MKRTFLNSLLKKLYTQLVQDTGPGGGTRCDETLLFMGGSPGELSEDLVTQEKRKKGWRMNCDVGEATEGLENEL